MENSKTLDWSGRTLRGAVPAISSKSQAHRALMAAALSDGPTELICPCDSQDIRASMGSLNALGATIRREGDSIFVTPLKKPEEIVQPDCGESGSTLRFLLPVLGILGISADLTLHGRLPDRPLSPLYEEMQRHGVTLSPQGSNPLQIRGKMQSGTYEIAGNVSSQFISGLLFALPLGEGSSEIRVTKPLQSRPYINLTKDILKKFGIDVATEEDDREVLFRIPGNQTYHSPGVLEIEGDWSNAAFFLAAGAMVKTPAGISPADLVNAGYGITVTGLNPFSRQGDKAIQDCLMQFGANLSPKIHAGYGNAPLADLTVCGGMLRGIKIDAADIPDLVPILALVAAAAGGTTKIHHVSRLRLKESDRVVSVLQTLRLLGANAEDDPAHDLIRIHGGKPLHGAVIDSCGDHRIVMMAAIASLVTRGPVTITGADAVQKSYPGFFDDLESLAVPDPEAAG